MRRQFYAIYDDLFEQYRRADAFPFRRRALQSTRRIAYITRAIEFAAADLGVTRRLRPDARFFLLVNIDQMVLAPLEHPESEGPPESFLTEGLVEDVRTILESAATVSDDDEISGHALVEGLAQVWDRLRATGANIWG